MSSLNVCVILDIFQKGKRIKNTINKLVILAQHDQLKYKWNKYFAKVSGLIVGECDENLDLIWVLNNKYNRQKL